MPAKADEIAVRMYRGVLGDCFLLTHTRPGEAGPRRYRALIDCGVLQCIGDRPLTKEALGHLPEIVTDLKRETGGVLDLVIATHEHYDHLSGFIRCHDLFKDFTLRQVWVAWTENRQDELANDIRARGKKALSALKAVVDQPAFAQRLALEAGAMTSEEDAEAGARLRQIQALLQFYDPEIEPLRAADAFGVAKKAARPYDPAASPPLSCENALAWLRWKAGEANVRYLEPGEVFAFGLDNALQAYVLGPPRSGQRLLQLNPSAGAGREVYLTKADDVAAVQGALRAYALAAADGDSRRPEFAPGPMDHPFAPRYRTAAADAPGLPTAKLYYDRAAENRRIDGEWLGSAELLALKIDSDVNNTSLALAIQAPGPDRHLLLFAADAQVGNWLSWHDQDYPSKPPDPDAPPTAETAPREKATDLLRRVVLYKVGHHGSHNATAAERGLELMTSPHLTALIPVVQAVAEEQTTVHNPDGWAMPYGDLYSRLKEMTAERIVRGDGDPKAERKAFRKAGGLFELSYAEGAGAPLWVELTASFTAS